MSGESYLHIIPKEQLEGADLFIDATYQGGRSGNAGDDPFPALLGMANQGGFRIQGSARGRLKILLLTSSMNDPDWPDTMDRETGTFTYYGDNKQPGKELHETEKDGNLILQRIFSFAHGGPEGRRQVPPIFLFARAGVYRDTLFLGLAVPGSPLLSANEDLVAIWRTKGDRRFQNYRARFTVLDTGPVNRAWIRSVRTGAPDDSVAPRAWLTWRETGRYQPLRASRTLEYRDRAAQTPSHPEGVAMIRAIVERFEGRPHAFEYCAAAIVRLMIPQTGQLDVTRPSRDGGRDAVGQMLIGRGPGAIFVDFAMEAKLYGPGNAVSISDVSRLISRLRHRQFGVLVTTSYLNLQAYKEIKEDEHPIVVIAASDIVMLLKEHGIGDANAVRSWLSVTFPPEA